MSYWLFCHRLILPTLFLFFLNKCKLSKKIAFSVILLIIIVSIHTSLESVDLCNDFVTSQNSIRLSLEKSQSFKSVRNISIPERLMVPIERGVHQDQHHEVLILFAADTTPWSLSSDNGMTPYQDVMVLVFYTKIKNAWCWCFLWNGDGVWHQTPNLNF